MKALVVCPLCLNMWLPFLCQNQSNSAWIPETDSEHLANPAHGHIPSGQVVLEGYFNTEWLRNVSFVRHPIGTVALSLLRGY